MTYKHMLDKRDMISLGEAFPQSKVTEETSRSSLDSSIPPFSNPTSSPSVLRNSIAS